MYAYSLSSGWMKGRLIASTGEKGGEEPAGE